MKAKGRRKASFVVKTDLDMPSGCLCRPFGAKRQFQTDLPLEILTKIADNLPVQSCNNLAKVNQRLREAVRLSLKDIVCHVQGYWREHDTKFEVIFERIGDEVVLARNQDEISQVFEEIQSIKSITIAVDADDHNKELLRSWQRLDPSNSCWSVNNSSDGLICNIVRLLRPHTLSLSFLESVKRVERLEWECDIDLQLTDVPESCSLHVCFDEDSIIQEYIEVHGSS